MRQAQHRFPGYRIHSAIYPADGHPTGALDGYQTLLVTTTIGEVNLEGGSNRNRTARLEAELVDIGGNNAVAAAPLWPAP
jgi:hypothetical protein